LASPPGSIQSINGVSTLINTTPTAPSGSTAPIHSKAAEKIVLVMDQLNTHSPVSLYEAFTPQEARRIAEKLEIHHMPKHGSWLNVAEIELSVLGRRLKERLGDKATLADFCTAFERERNIARAGVNWCFTTIDARIKLARLYPVT
jgi:hypothetical protein